MFVNGKSYSRYSRMKIAQGANQHTFFISMCTTISQKNVGAKLDKTMKRGQVGSWSKLFLTVIYTVNCWP